ncbi:hypothetical protein FOA52_005270 [Chlamydomonas sp. UWO 241]|nr:hypothetical protein FOA52_005270 [Chlamydomonas sp. UWO 241]
MSELLVRNHLLQVCEALLDERVEEVVNTAGVSEGRSSARLVEVATGITANVCAHDGLMSERVADSLLPGLVLRLLWAPDTACICEMCRAVSVALRMQGKERWLRHIAYCTGWLPQLLSVADNTLDASCLEKLMDAAVAVAHAVALTCAPAGGLQGSGGDAGDDDGGAAAAAAAAGAAAVASAVGAAVGDEAAPAGAHGAGAGAGADEHGAGAGADGHGAPAAAPPHDASIPAGGGSASVAAAADACGIMLTSELWGGLLGAACTVLSAAVEQQEGVVGGGGGGGGGSGSPASALDGAGAGGGRGGAPQPPPSVRITPACADAALRLLEQMAASPGGRRALVMGVGGDEADAGAAGVVAAGHAGVVPAQLGGGDAQRLPHLLFRLMECAEDGQVLESLVIVLVDCAPLLLPHLAADPRPLERLSQLVAEVTADAQETVVQAVWFLTAAAMQHLVASTRGAGEAAAAAVGGAAAPPCAEHVLAAFESLHVLLALLPDFESCDAHVVRCKDMLRELGSLACEPLE